MGRFQNTNKSYGFIKPLVLCGICLALLLFFSFGSTLVSKGNISRQEDTLQKTIEGSISFCYAIEGAYPESLEYIKENYGLSYDEKHFYVDYQAQGANIIPSFTIIYKEN